jgi:cytochrome c
VGLNTSLRHFAAVAVILLVAAAVRVAMTPAMAQVPVGGEASVARGQAAYQARCTACHAVDANNTGPLHQGVVGRQAGRAPGYVYSNAVRDSGLVWTRANLLAWLQNPEALIPGQLMDYSVDVPRDREDLVAYLATLTTANAPSPVTVTNAPTVPSAPKATSP